MPDFGIATLREKLTLPEGGRKLLLHSCCAPCSGEVMEAIIASGIEFKIFREKVVSGAFTLVAIGEDNKPIKIGE